MKTESKNGVDKRKLQIFLIFLLCSFLIWLISKLSETYTERASYELVFVQVPDSLMLTNSSKGAISARIQSSGFQMLSSGFKRNQINIDVSQARQRGNRYFIAPAVYRRQMEQQLSGSVSIQDVDTDTLFLELYSLVARKVPVRADLSLDLSQNYMIRGPVELIPDSIIIRGPENEVKRISEITTEPLELVELQQDFTREIRLKDPDTANSLNLETDRVVVRGEVFRFSEKIVEVPVNVLNLPENTEIKIIPNTIEVLCRAELENLKALQASQFALEVDFNDIREGSKFLPVMLRQKPETVQSAQIMVDKVEYLVMRQ
ncbi:MAG: hypothetical protein KJP14_08280 [Eudoraea sp.]|nr:hypothetical protein [Eudoraea sp.]MBT8210511.1 hypothetical protein [Eudoraea sp.]